MRKGIDLATMANELDYQNENKRDFIVSTENIKLSHDGTDFLIEIKDHSRKKVRKYVFEMSKHMLGQVSAFTRVPMGLIQTLVERGGEGRKYLVKLVTSILTEEPTQRMIRTMGRHNEEPFARAFLSDRYRPLDNYDLLQTIFPVINKYKGQVVVESCDVTDTHMYLKIRNPKFSYKIGTHVNAKGRKVDDVIEAGVIISNSEVGAGALTMKPFITRLVCMNGATITTLGRVKRRNHIGSKHERGIGFDNFELVPTVHDIVNDAAFWEVVRESLEYMLTNKTMFTVIAERFEAIKKNKIKGHVPTVMREIAKRYQLAVHESEAILKILVKSGDLTQFGLVNAVTRFARDPKQKMTYDRATELETIGGKLIEMPDPVFRHISSMKEKPKGQNGTPTRSF